jgi:hypothetical protein
LKPKIETKEQQFIRDRYTLFMVALGNRFINKEITYDEWLKRTKTLFDMTLEDYMRAAAIEQQQHEAKT